MRDCEFLFEDSNSKEDSEENGNFEESTQAPN
jgi:hypothetical protein